MEKYTHRDVRDSESYIGVDGIMKLGSQIKKKQRYDKVNKLNVQIDDLLKKEFVEKVRRILPESWETIMAVLSYESEPPMLMAKLNEPPEEERTFIIKSAKKEGIRFLYEKLERLAKEIDDAERTNNN